MSRVFGKKSLMIIILISGLVGSVNFLQAQVVDYNKQYFMAKQLFREGKYNLAMESFKPLIPYDQRNQFSAYASFYYALAAYHQGFLAVAKDMFTQVKSVHPTWDKMDEVNYWLGKVHLESKDYFQGMKTLSYIQDKKLLKDADQVKLKTLATVTDVETLKRLRDAYPKDEAIARSLVTLLSKDMANPANRTQVEALVKEYNFKRTEYIPEAPKTFHKDVYSVSVMLPFMVNSLDPTAGRKRNQIILDLYEGMKLAADTLEKQGIRISLRAYDTERNITKIKNILSTDELKSTDLIVGPYFQEENDLIQEFSQAQKVNVFNPLSGNSDITGVNPFAFLFQPSYETLGRKSAEFLAHYKLKKKNCMVFYGTTRRDSLMAANFIQTANANGLTVVSALKISKESVGKIIPTLATATEYDEFKYPKQFTLKKDSLGSIYVASDDALIYAKVLSSIEQRGDSILVLGSEDWIEQPVVGLEKFQTLPVVLAAPNATIDGNKHYAAFFRKFLKEHGRTPDLYARIGYEFMLFAGNQLKKNGVYFQEDMSKQTFIPGFLTSGFNFQLSRDNQLVPFISLKDGKVRLVDKR